MTRGNCKLRNSIWHSTTNDEIRLTTSGAMYLRDPVLPVSLNKAFSSSVLRLSGDAPNTQSDLRRLGLSSFTRPKSNTNDVDERWVDVASCYKHQQYSLELTLWDSVTLSVSTLSIRTHKVWLEIESNVVWFNYKSGKDTSKSLDIKCLNEQNV